MIQQSLFSELDKERRSKMTWRPEAPPCLDGIDDIQVDCETTGLQWWAGDLPIGIAIRYGDKSQYLPWGHLGGGNLDEAVVKRWAKCELRGKHITNLNTRFDIHQLFQWGVDIESQGCTVSDVGHYAALLDDRRHRFSLENLAKDFLEEGRGKVKLTSGGEILDVTKMAEYHAGEVEAYAREDVNLVVDLRTVMWPQLDEQELQRVRQLEDDVIFPVCEMERNAAPVDMEKLKVWVRLSEQKYNQYNRKLKSLTGMDINVESRKDMARLFKQLNLDTAELPLTDKGMPSFAADVLENYDHEVIKLVLSTRRLGSLRDKYLLPYWKTAQDTNGKLMYALHQLRTDDYGTVRGRFSSSQILTKPKVGINGQQVPAVEKQQERFGNEFIIRELFIPEEGQLLLSADAAQIEYRLFAHYANSPKILEKYDADPTVSFHKIIMKMVEPFKAGIKYKSVKNLNFAKIYGAGKDKMALMLGLDRQESDMFVNIYDRMFPEVPKLLYLASEMAKLRGYVFTLLGRRARFKRTDRLYSALNAVIQGTAADIMKKKLVELFRERKILNFKMRITVHDEVVGDVPDEASARRCLELLNDQSFPQLKVPILWVCTIGKNWAECADENNRLAEAA